MRSVNEDRLQKTLEYILEYQKRESKAPTYRQIQKECGYNSLGTVAADVARLKKRHLIESTRRALLGEQSRTLESRRRHASPGARKEEEETRSEPPPREDATQPG